MKSFRKTIILRLVLLCAIMIAFGAGESLAGEKRSDMTSEQRQHKLDSLETALRRSSVPRERLRTLYNIYDLSLQKNRRRDADRLYQAALVAQDSIAILDALRIRTTEWMYNDSAQSLIQKAAELMPPTSYQKEVVTYIRLTRARTAARTLKDSVRSEKLHNMIMNFSNDNAVDLYRRIEMLGTLCIFLTDGAAGKLLFDYMQKLESMIKLLPQDSPGILRNFFYATASNAATFGMRSIEAIRYSKGRLQMIEQTDRRYSDEGRHFHNFDTDKYRAYLLMLMNYTALTPQEIDHYYNEIEKLSATNTEVAEDRNDTHIAAGFYSLSKKQYHQAMEHLKIAADACAGTFKETMILKGLLEASRNAGDKDALIYAYDCYVPILEKHSAGLDQDRILEYQILHDITQLRNTNASLVSNMHNSEVSKRNSILFMAGICLVILLILLIWIVVAFTKSRKMAKQQIELNRQLKLEREAMRKTEKELIAARDKAREAEKQASDFVTIFSHEISEPANAIMGYTQLIVDSVEGKRRQVLESFIKTIQLNSELMKTLVNDVLDASELENTNIVLKYTSIDMYTLCKFATESVTVKPNPDVKIEISPLPGTNTEANIDTDIVRASQVLVNIIGNATKFTEKGFIRIKYGIDESRTRAMFIVEDSGPGIPADKATSVFERFQKVSKTSGGIGLGLYIARKVARMLGGDVVLDSSYTHGARFIFTIPVNMTGSECPAEENNNK